MKIKFLLPLLFISFCAFSQTAPPQADLRIYDIIDSVSADRIEADIKKLASFGTRNTFSDTISDTRGIGAARRWIKSEFDKISENCSDCLDVFYQKDFVTKEGNSRVPHDAWVVNVVAVQKGIKYPNRYIIMSGDIDSRASNTMDYTTDAPGAN
ncbi:MAG TPA: peptidase M28, partial [Salinimicrobium sp.]|nr:peptidase M28 [Salinimicrobium sp.]